ncbi:ATP-binding protein [Streptomyces niveiscabiei]|uniref:ATP-binding protein n=1 Tax=Streptomyces niveiscabiei TaxID=164115 RepID=UPI0029BA607A|nr:ATP-binding protein [Streptomyces niveiscabiei]MDX3383776.1 ATP-binding protein [Streptomyces niveiscabiei]
MNSESPQTPAPLPALTFCVQLSPTRRGARLARLLVTEQLRCWGLPLYPAQQVIAELANNAATHGRVPGRDFRVAMYVLGETLRLEVTDTRDDAVPNCRLPLEEGESGRGLALVEALTDRWGVAFGPTPRKTVWAEIGLRPDRLAGNGVPVGGSSGRMRCGHGSG